MPNRDLYNNIEPEVVRAPAAAGTTGTKTGSVIDLAGYDGCTFIISSGAQTTTGITVTPVVKEGAVTGTLTSVADANLLNTEALAAAVLAGATGASKVAKIGYKGSSRYVSCDLVVTGAATGLYGITCIRSHPKKAPV